MAKMKITDVDFLRLLPNFMRDDPYNIALAKLLNKYSAEISSNVQYLPVWNQIQKMPLDWLEELAYEYDADFYDSSATDEKKAELLKETLRLKAKRGTYNATDRLLDIYLGKGFMQEWYEYDGEPYTFRIFTTNNLVDPGNYQKLLAALRYSKNARSYMSEFFYLWDMGDTQIQMRYEGKRGKWVHRYTGMFPYPYWSGKATDLNLELEPKTGGFDSMYCSLDAYSEDGYLLYEEG